MSLGDKSGKSWNTMSRNPKHVTLSISPIFLGCIAQRIPPISVGLCCNGDISIPRYESRRCCSSMNHLTWFLNVFMYINAAALYAHTIRVFVCVCVYIDWNQRTESAVPERKKGSQTLTETYQMLWIDKIKGICVLQYTPRYIKNDLLHIIALLRYFRKCGYLDNVLCVFLK